ncbi:hypothetical protein P3X46_016915 [Hevea brasiliensis]|uniref:F-box domain-containing protein n=1 Tax=Hevea brasiliensis TaxID=3981 RepID=A0ABQ9M467_HEVBR|nr:hypothetical protein P3X46_016915 [Hevea brasiliensis]
MAAKINTDTTTDHPMICHLQGMCSDLVANIMSRVDGLALASLACTSSDLRGIARHHGLWENLCHSTWPSTARAQHLISPSLIRHFDQFFADSYPLIFYDEAAKHSSPKVETSTSPPDFVSLVDIYYKNQCVLSRVLHGIPEAVDVSTPKLMDDNCYMISNDDDLGYADIDNDNLGHTNNSERSTLDEKSDNCKELMEDLRLSWVLLDKKTGKAVNLSTWKPFTAQTIWPHGDYVMQFGSIIPFEEKVLPQKLTRCTITTKFKVTEMHGNFQWRQISMSVENVTGSLLDGKTSLMILNKALYSMRSTNWLKVENGLNQYEKQKRGLIRRKELKENLANRIYISVEIVVLTLLHHTISKLF